MWKYQDIDELYHYGIIGMKWGMRKARIKGIEYNYKSIGQKKYERRVEKLSNKQNKKENDNKKLNYHKDHKLEKSKIKLERLIERDKNREDYARNTSIGKSVVKTILFGGLGSGNYNRFRAAGHGRVLSALGSSLIPSTLGYPLSYMISRGSENRQAKRQVRLKEDNKNDKNDKNNINNKNIKKNRNNTRQKIYDKYMADDIEGVLKNMNKEQVAEIESKVSKSADWPGIESYVMKNSKKYLK